MKRKIGSWRKGLRRFAALFLAVLTVWFVALTADLGASADTLANLGRQTAFAAAVLRSELGAPAEENGPLSGISDWQRLVVRQSPMLLAAAAEDWQAGTEDEQSHGEEPEPSEVIPDTSASADDVVERTVAPTDASGYDYGADVYIQNPTEAEVDVAAMAAAEVPVALGTEGPQILILHTHGSEAYTPDGTDVYEESSSYRTTDTQYNVVRVGDEMAEVFSSYGIQVIHDRTLYDYPQYNGAYTRSAASIEKYLEQYPSIQVILDVHRDAIIDANGTNYKVVTEADGQKVAQVMLVVGTDLGGAAHPDWRQNLTFAVKLQQQMNGRYPTLARPIALRAARYNQQYRVGSLLVEVGSHGNTLQEAIAGGRRFAAALAELLEE